jgi:ADP-heptose:LPS heptosyltransferase
MYFVNNPYVDNILVWDDFSRGTGKIFALAKFLRPYHFTDGFMILPNETLAYSFFLAGIKRRYGTSRKPYHIITGTKALVRDHEKIDKSEAEWCLDFVKAAGGTVEDISTAIYLTDEEKEKTKEIKKRLSSNGEKVVGVHITNGGSASNMPAEEYLRLLNLLKDAKNMKIVVTDNQLPEGVNIPEWVEQININKSLRQAIVNFAALDLLVSSATGTMHICGALKVNTLSLFCPLPACKPSLWGPVGNRARFIMPTLHYCATKCNNDPKNCNFNGEGGINAELVFSEINSVLESF